jgi:hypothetical protein
MHPEISSTPQAVPGLLPMALEVKRQGKGVFLKVGAGSGA